MEDRSVNLGAVFAEYLTKLKMKPMKGTSTKRETVGSLITPISRHLGIRMNGVTVIRTRLFLDAAHLTSTQWLKEGCYWSYVDEDSGHLLELPQQTVTEFDGDVTRLAFHLDPILHQDLAHHTRSSRRTALARRPQFPTHPGHFHE